MPWCKGQGEVICKTIGNFVMQTMKAKPFGCCKVMKFSCEQDTGCKAVFHAMKHSLTRYEKSNHTRGCYYIPLISRTGRSLFSNAKICPSISLSLINTYHSNSWLFAVGQCKPRRHSNFNSYMGCPQIEAICYKSFIRKSSQLQNFFSHLKQ